MGCEQSTSLPPLSGSQVEKGLGAQDPAPKPGEYLRLVLISDELPEYDMLIQAAKHNAGIATMVIHYDGMTINSLLAAIHKKVGPRKGKLLSIAHLDHGHKGQFRLLKGHDVDLKALHNNARLAQFFKSIGSYCDPQQGRFDLLACSVAEGKEGHLFVEHMRKVTGIEVAASNNKTGSDGEVADAYDWILEDGGADAATAYFDKEKLRHWHHHMSDEEEEERFQVFLWGEDEKRMQELYEDAGGELSE
jgi:hypothetical protein